MIGIKCITPIKCVKWLRFMAKPEKTRESGEGNGTSSLSRKSVGWRLTVGLRQRVAAEAKAQGEEIEALVEKWLDDKVSEAEDARYRERLKRKSQEKRTPP